MRQRDLRKLSVGHSNTRCPESCCCPTRSSQRGLHFQRQPPWSGRQGPQDCDVRIELWCLIQGEFPVSYATASRHTTNPAKVYLANPSSRLETCARQLLQMHPRKFAPGHYGFSKPPGLNRLRGRPLRSRLRRYASQLRQLLAMKLLPKIVPPKPTFSRSTSFCRRDAE